MDLITTGRTALDRESVFRVTEELRLLIAAREGQRMTVGQIRQVHMG